MNRDISIISNVYCVSIHWTTSNAYVLKYFHRFGRLWDKTDYASSTNTCIYMRMNKGMHIVTFKPQDSLFRGKFRV